VRSCCSASSRESSSVSLCVSSAITGASGRAQTVENEFEVAAPVRVAPRLEVHGGRGSAGEEREVCDREVVPHLAGGDDASPETRRTLLDPAVMGPPIVWLASEEAAGVHDERIVAVDFENWLARR
jgi:hypothetical protein